MGAHSDGRRRHEPSTSARRLRRHASSGDSDDDVRCLDEGADAMPRSQAELASNRPRNDGDDRRAVVAVERDLVVRVAWKDLAHHAVDAVAFRPPKLCWVSVDSATAEALTIATTVCRVRRPSAALLPRVTTATSTTPPGSVISTSSLTAPERIAVTVPIHWLRALVFRCSTFSGENGTSSCMPVSSSRRTKRWCTASSSVVALDELPSALGQPGAAAAAPAGGALDERLARQRVHRVDRVPGALVAHAERLRGLRDRARLRRPRAAARCGRGRRGSRRRPRSTASPSVRGVGFGCVVALPCWRPLDAPAAGRLAPRECRVADASGDIAVAARSALEVAATSARPGAVPSTRPLLICTTSSARLRTSSSSWVISSIGKLELGLQVLQLVRAAARAGALSSAANGSSSSSAVGFGDQRARQRRALTLAAGDLVRIVAGDRLEMEGRDPALDCRIARCGAAGCSQPLRRAKAMFCRTVRCGNSA